jgi:hypothetical protein
MIQATGKRSSPGGVIEPRTGPARRQRNQGASGLGKMRRRIVRWSVFSYYSQLRRVSRARWMDDAIDDGITVLTSVRPGLVQHPVSTLLAPDLLRVLHRGFRSAVYSVSAILHYKSPPDCITLRRSWFVRTATSIAEGREGSFQTAFRPTYHRRCTR